MVEPECRVGTINTCTVVVSSYAAIKNNIILMIASGGHVQLGSYFLYS